MDLKKLIFSVLVLTAIIILTCNRDKREQQDINYPF